MPMQLTNNAASLLSVAIGSTTTTTIQITSGDEFRFPVADTSTDKWFPVTVIANDGRREIMKCTKRVGVNLTVTRGYEGTTKLTFPVNSRVEVRMTAGSLMEATSNASNFTQGTIPDKVLPARLRAIEMQLSSVDGDCNDINESGRYWCPKTVDHIPPVGTTLNGFLWCDVVSSSIQYQEWIAYGASDERWRRQKVGGSWTAAGSGWEKVWNIKPDFIPIGTIFDFAGKTLPAGWLWCGGQRLNRGDSASDTYYNLFKVIGTEYNSTGTPDTQFCVPDLRGRVAAGKDDMNGTKANRLTASADTIGDMDGTNLGLGGGAQTHVLTEAQMPSHNHTVTWPTTLDGKHDHAVITKNQDGSSDSQWLAYFKEDWKTVVKRTGFIVDDGAHKHAITIGNAGSDKAHNIVQPTLIVNKIIKYASL